MWPDVRFRVEISSELLHTGFDPRSPRSQAFARRYGFCTREEEARRTVIIVATQQKGKTSRSILGGLGVSLVRPGSKTQDRGWESFGGFSVGAARLSFRS